jgi:protein-L-isoaspartate(D-aspartate) O-methyltransferase
MRLTSWHFALPNTRKSWAVRIARDVHGLVDSWNLRDQHMFDTLERLFDFHGSGSKGIVWAHNSHVGDAAFTEMGARGEFNVGQLCRTRFAHSAFIVGFGTDRGTVAASSEWDGSMEFKEIVPTHEASYDGYATIPAWKHSCSI